MASRLVFPKLPRAFRWSSRLSRRFQSTNPQPKSNPRVEKIHSRLPRFLQKYTAALKNAPITHITAFLVLHEITAVVPLLGLAATFHYAHWLPPYISEGKYISDGVEKFGRYFRKRGWFGEVGVSGRDKWYGRGESVTKIIVELATAYTITKVLLPVRLIFSVWGTPWFARVAIVPFTNGFKRLFRSKKKANVALPSGSAAAGTGAATAGVVAKDAKTPSSTTLGKS